MDKYVYIVFEEVQRSCDRDYGDDGYMIIWDSDELGRNLTVEQLAKEIKKNDIELHNSLIKHMKEELQLNDFGLADDYLTEIMEYLNDETVGGLYIFYYQNFSSIKEVYKTEKAAKKIVAYYTDNHSYRNRHYYEKFRLLT